MPPLQRKWLAISPNSRDSNLPFSLLPLPLALWLLEEPHVCTFMNANIFNFEISNSGCFIFSPSWPFACTRHVEPRTDISAPWWCWQVNPSCLSTHSRISHSINKLLIINLFDVQYLTVFPLLSAIFFDRNICECLARLGEVPLFITAVGDDFGGTIIQGTCL